MGRILITLIVAAAGGLLGVKLKIPAGAMIGAMFSVALFNILSGKASIPVNFRLVAQMVVGGMIGLKFTKETIYQLKELIVPAIILVVGFMIFSVALGYLIYKVTGLELMTALFSTSPGGLTDMTLIADAYGAETPKIAVMHMMRLVSVITILPIVIKALTHYIKTHG